MSKQITRRIGNALIWLGLALIVFGCAMTYPIMRDAIEAQSASASLSFVVTLEPAPIEPTLASLASSAAPAPPAAPNIAGPDPTPTPTPAPSATIADVTATVTPIPSPAILPDNATVSPVRATAQATPQPVPTASGETPSRLVIPAIQLDAPVITVGWHVEQVGGAPISVWDVPDWRAAGWLKTSAPAGQKGNTVLDGHHNIAGEVFRRLVDLKPGDKIELHAGSQVFTYGVTEKQILPDRDQPMDVRIANAKYIQPTQDERLTLVTCWPYTNNTHRLIIVARPLSSNKGKEIE